MNIDTKEYLFPFEKCREGQDKLLKNIFDTLSKNGKILVSAPTGTGKTISGLGPALSFALKNKLRIIYLTSRKSQVNQVLQTIEKINSKFQLNIRATGFIGKKDMCINKFKEKHKGNFYDFCKNEVKNESCEYNEMYKELKGTLPERLDAFPSTTEVYLESCKLSGVCPHKTSFNKLPQSHVIVGDYNYFFQKGIRDLILAKAGIELDKVILIVDEAHNLVDRVRDSYSKSITNTLIEKARDELEEGKITVPFKDEEIGKLKIALKKIESYLIGKIKDNFSEEEKQIQLEKEDFKKLFDGEGLGGYENVYKDFEIKASLIASRYDDEDEFESDLDAIAKFMRYWVSEKVDDSFVRFIKSKLIVSEHNQRKECGIYIKNLDPSEIIYNEVKDVFGVVMMSATLEPLEKYEYDLGMKGSNKNILESPFSKENARYVCLTDFSSTKNSRTEENYEKIANKIVEIITTFKKNSILFFPNYSFLKIIVGKVSRRLGFNEYKIFEEEKGMDKIQKDDIISEFKKPNNKPQILFANSGGSFYEGVDLPDKALEIVCLIGFQQGVPNFINKSLMNHYEKKGMKSQAYNYTYIFPALGRSIQAGGRCIRELTDVGLIFLLDYRYQKYSPNLPKHWNLEFNTNTIELKKWFDEKDQNIIKKEIQLPQIAIDFINENNLDENVFIEGYKEVFGNDCLEEEKPFLENNLKLLKQFWEVQYSQYFKEV